MLRAAPSLLLGLSIALAALSAPAPSPDVKEPAKKGQGATVDEIKKAIDDLGSKRFTVRDKAKKFLMEIGAPAESYLEQAAKSPDEEIASSAKAILERFQWGLYPDTPKAVRDLIEQFRIGAPEERQTAIGELLKMREVPIPTLRKLMTKEQNPELREQMLARMVQQVRESVPGLLLQADYAAVENLYDLLIGAQPTLFGKDYSVFLLMRGKLDAAIARFEAVRQKGGDEADRAAEMLVYLYRCKADWPAARKAAEQSKKDELVDQVLWQSFDWKALAAANRQPETGKAIWVGAAYDRLAGNRKSYQEKVDEIKKSAEEQAEDWVALRLEANALLLNGKANDAIAILVDRKREMAFTFDLLCAQMRHKEAFDLVKDAQHKDTDMREAGEIEVRRARMLYLLGDKDRAIQLFNTIMAERIKGREQFALARSLIKAESRLGVEMADKTRDDAAACIDTMMKEGQRDSFSQLLEPVFGDDKENAETWWALFRKEQPKEVPTVAMKRVHDVVRGKLERKQLDEWLVKLQNQPKEENPRPDAQRNLLKGARVLDAMAAAYEAIGELKKAEEYLTKAAEKSNQVSRWIKLGDFLVGMKRFKDAGAAYARGAKLSENREGEILENDDDLQQLLEEQNPALPTYLQARAALLDGDVKESKRLAELAHWLPLGNEIVRAKLVDELNKRDWPEMARKEADMLLKSGWYSNYTYGNVLSFLARQSAKGKDFFTAADYYEKCLVGCLRTGAQFVEPTAYLLVPESIRLYRARGFLAKGKIDEAIEEANANLAVMPGNVDLAIKLVPELVKQGKKKEADAIYEKVRDVCEKLTKDYPESAYAHNTTAWIMANCRRDLDAALKHAEKAVKLDPKSAGYIDTLAEVNFRRGDREKAIALMKKCVELDPKHRYFRKQLTRLKDQSFDSPTPDEGDDE